eukprot:3351373-Pleurochrysis_carterae.AAC.2
MTSALRAATQKNQFGYTSILRENGAVDIVFHMIDCPASPSGMPTAVFGKRISHVVSPLLFLPLYSARAEPGAVAVGTTIRELDTRVFVMAIASSTG